MRKDYDDDEESQKTTSHSKYSSTVVMINYLFLFIGSVSSTLLCKYYFIHKGSSIWVSTLVQTAGFPLLLFPIFLRSSNRKPFTDVTPYILFLSIVIGLFLGVNNILFSLGSLYLPVSTSSLLLSSQLVFNLILSVLIVKQKITYQNLNCVVLLTLSSILLALGESHDRPHGLTKVKYFLGFACTVGAGLLFALYLPLMEKIYKRVNCYTMVMEMQIIMEAVATAVAVVGMAANGGFGEMRRESMHAFDKGEAAYWAVVICNTVTWQMCFMATAGMVFLTTSLTSGICMTALMAMNVVGGVIVYGDPFGGFKVVATVLCTWGFGSYVYGMRSKPNASPENNATADLELEAVSRD